MSTSPEDQANAVLMAVGELLGREIALDDLLRMLIDRIVQSMNADRGTLYLIDPGRKELFSKVAHLPELKEIRLKMGQGIAGHVAASGEKVNASHTSHELHFFREIDRKTGYRTRSVLAVPMRDHRNRIIGVVQVLNKKEGRFNAEDEALLERLAKQAAMALEATTLYQELRRVEAQPEAPLSYRYNRIVGESEAMHLVYRLMQKAAATTATVLLRGESGTGKEVIARAIQVNGARRDRPFIKVDCAALPTGLIENELFGHEKGAYTSAGQRSIGKFEAASGGTVFIDEIGELPLPVQGKLLRVLQDREFERVGGNETIKVDVRIIAATNRNLERLVEEGRFRADLYYRIRVVQINLPPLRVRGEQDIRRLVSHFAGAAARRHGRDVPAFTDQALARLLQYGWPGNVRELENCIESAVVLCDGERIDAADLPLPSRGPVAPAGGSRLGTELEPPPLERPGLPPGGGWSESEPVGPSRDGGWGQEQSWGQEQGPWRRDQAAWDAEPGQGIRGGLGSSGDDATPHGEPAGGFGREAAWLGRDSSGGWTPPERTVWRSRGPAPATTQAQPGGPADDDTRLTLAEVERRHILRVLEASRNNRTVAAKVLGIGRNTLIRKLRDYGLSEDE